MCHEREDKRTNRRLNDESICGGKGILQIFPHLFLETVKFASSVLMPLFLSTVCSLENMQLRRY